MGYVSFLEGSLPVIPAEIEGLLGAGLLGSKKKPTHVWCDWKPNKESNDQYLRHQYWNLWNLSKEPPTKHALLKGGTLGKWETKITVTQ